MRRVVATIAGLLTLLQIALPLQAAQGEVDFSFPLGAHYRVGRYIPVRIIAHDLGNASARVDAPGVVPTVVNPSSSGTLDAVVPLLIVSPIEGQRAPGMIPHVMRPLQDDERLVGRTSPDADLASELFSGKSVIAVALDLSNPLPGPAMAWGALDAVFLDAAAAARVTEGQLATLLAAGTAVAVRTDGRPASRWDWQRHGAWWVARPEGPPVGGVIQPERYATSSTATPGWPLAVRRSVVLILGAFAFAAVAASLWRSRYAWAAVVFLSLAVVVSLMLWRAAQQVTVETVTTHRAGPWLDTLTHRAAVADGEFRHTVDSHDAAVWPMLWSRRQLQEAGLRLECNADGTPKAFVGRLKRGQSIAFLARSAEATPTPPAATARAAPPR